MPADAPRIDRAAIRLMDGRVFDLPRPARHGDVIGHIVSTTDLTHVSQGHTQGFVTDAGDFVDRYDGARIAHAAGQIAAPKESGVLFSEDLW